MVKQSSPLLPAAATVIGLLVLGQVPTVRDLAGIALVILGVALHRDAAVRLEAPAATAPAAGLAEPVTSPGDLRD